MRFRNILPFFFLIALVVAIPGNLHAQPAWRHLGDLHEARNVFGAISIGDGRVLVMGGYNAGGYGEDGVFMMESRPTASCEIIDAIAETVSQTGALNVPRAEAVYLLTPDSNVIAISGVYNDYWQLTPSCELYDRSKGTWRVLGDLKVPRRQHTACFISNDEVLVVGGRNEDLSAMATAEIFNIRTGESRLVADYMHPVSTPVSAVAPDGRIIVFSGREGGANSLRSRNVYQYDREQDRWNKVGELPEAINVPFNMMLWNGDVLMAGGATQESPLTQSNKVLRYVRDGFTNIGAMGLARTWHGQAQFDQESIILTGGLTEMEAATDRCEVVDLSTGESRELPKLKTGRRYLQTVSIPIWSSGGMRLKVLAIAGQSSAYQPLASIEVYEKDAPAYVARPLITRDGDFLVSNEAMSYQWNYSGDPISGANDQRFHVREPGIYTVTVVKDGQTTTSLPYYLMTTLGVSHGSHVRGLMLSPSPVVDRLNISLDLTSAVPVVMELADMCGSTVMRLDEGMQYGSYSREISMKDLPVGIYVLRLRVGMQSMVRKIVKQ